VIALFGAYGVTGHYFLKFALEAGYSVRALILPGVVLEDMEGNDKLTLVTGTFEEEHKIQRVVKKAAYVVCMINDCESTLQDDSEPSNNFSFIQRLVPIMEQCRACPILLYQVSSYSTYETTCLLPSHNEKVVRAWR
jgi:nucleoside-diphosphate-sugar epimerase